MLFRMFHVCEILSETFFLSYNCYATVDFIELAQLLAKKC